MAKEKTPKTQGRKKSTPAATVETEKAKPSEVKRLITGPQLNALLKAKRHTAQEMDTINAGYRAKLAHAVEKQYLHKKAYATLVQLDKMEPEVAADYWDNLLAYMDLAGITQKIESVQKLPIGGEADDGDGENGDDADADADEKVARPQFGGTKKATTASTVDEIRDQAGASPATH